MEIFLGSTYVCVCVYFAIYLLFFLFPGEKQNELVEKNMQQWYVIAAKMQSEVCTDLGLHFGGGIVLSVDKTSTRRGCMYM